MTAIKRVYPSTPSASGSCALSILDSAVSNYTISGAVWLFSPPTPTPSPGSSSTYDPERLEESLGNVLSSYPEWCGTLHLVDYKPEFSQGQQQRQTTDHTKRFGRVHLTWGRNDDPGVQFEGVRRDDTLAQHLPSPVPNHEGVYDNATIKDADLFPSSASLVKLRAPPSASPTKPCMLVKVTTFACGGASVAVGLHHSLADAAGLSSFMRDWASVHRQLLNNGTITLPSRPLEPFKIDSFAAGNIDAESEDEELKDTAERLPRLALDFWASEGDKPPMISSPTTPHPSIVSLDQQLGTVRGDAVPWKSWEYEKAVKDHLFDFTPRQIDVIWQRSSQDGRKVSKLDALLGHLWKIVVRARQLHLNDNDNDASSSSMSISIGLRQRLGLEPSFRGSPIILLAASLPASTILEDSSSEIASTIRHSVESATPSAISALLHHYAFALDPIREWHAFMGNNHLMVTSWLGSGGYEVDFGSGRPVCVTSQMWAIDGLVVIMDAVEKDAGREGNSGSDRVSTSKRWYETGTRVRLFLQDQVMERVLADSTLFN